MKLLGLVVFYFLEISNCQVPPIEGNCDSNGDLRLVHNRGEKFRAVQICSSTKWKYFSTCDKWTEEAARLACRQLNLGYLDASTSALQLTSSVGPEGLKSYTCAETANQLSDCIQLQYFAPHTTTVATVNCSNGDVHVCSTNGAMRLADGSTYSEGRLEICHNGQWGTICNQGWTDSRASQVCSRLGLPTYNATLQQFSEGTGFVYTINCMTLDGDISNCIQESSCGHSMDVGVKCLPFTDACVVPVNESIATGVTDACVVPVNESIATGVTLGALIGLLAVALVVLVVVVAGWIGTCVYLQRKINKHHTHSTPVSTNDSTLQHTPHNEGDERLYDTINDTVTNLEHSNFVKCIRNESYSLDRGKRIH